MTYWGLHRVGIYNIVLVIVGATLSTRFLQGNDILAKATCSLEFGIGFFTLLYEVFPIGSEGNLA